MDNQEQNSGQLTNERCVVALGSNLGDRQSYLRAALKYLDNELGQVVGVSSLYETRPWHAKGSPKLGQANYHNAVVLVSCLHDPNKVLATLLRIEARLGRVRTSSLRQSFPRTLDLDLIAIGQKVIEQESLTLPHPRLHLRDFVLMPFAEIAPDWSHPLLATSAKKLLTKLQSSPAFDKSVIGMTTNWV
jgi:2-amino-4-hydroxy-6-hydroxymethyldihydropteridine diphosphokinase